MAFVGASSKATCWKVFLKEPGKKKRTDRNNPAPGSDSAGKIEGKLAVWVDKGVRS